MGKIVQYFFIENKIILPYKKTKVALENALMEIKIYTHICMMRME